MLKFFRTELILAATVALSFTSCVKKPDAPVSPSAKITVEMSETGKIYAVNFGCGLKNENDSVAFTSVDGTFEIKNSSGSVLVSIPFKKDAILPFETGIIQQRVELSPDKAAPLLELLAIDSAKLESGEDPGNRFVDEKNISIKKLDFEKTSIIDLLRSRTVK